MQKKFLKEVVNLVVGKQAEDIVDLLAGKKNVNEFLLAKKLDLTINQTRNILYKLSDFGLVSSIRKKDKKKGWYTYFWKIETVKSLEFLKNVVKKRIEQLNYQLNSRETKLFYVCKRCNIELTEENALLHEFICNECGDVFTLKDNSKLINVIKRDISKLEEELKLIENELEIEQKKEEKQKEREAKKAAKEKKAGKKKSTKKKSSKNKTSKSKKETTKKTSRSSSKNTLKRKSSSKKTIKKKSTKKKSSKNKTSKKIKSKKVK